uniref:Uncharacterized protein n=1 Tax=Arundo donax TaxID=35708 RepID=A0A0A9GT04_ARUDO
MGQTNVYLNLKRSPGGLMKLHYLHGIPWNQQIHMGRIRFKFEMA